MNEQDIDVGVTLHVREWPGSGRPFVLLHGLASSARLWDEVAEHLAGAGQRVIAYDQRGHGASGKPAEGYGFTELTSDLAGLLGRLDVRRPILVGHSWGGNVALEYAARNPAQVAGLALVDGGFIDMRDNPAGSPEAAAKALPTLMLAGAPKAAVQAKLPQLRPQWSPRGIEAMLDLFDTLPNGTIQPKLSSEHHLAILRAMWVQRPDELFPLVQAPALICLAVDQNAEWVARKRLQVERARAGLAHSELHEFIDSDHDIHLCRPVELAALFQEAFGRGFWPAE